MFRDRAEGGADLPLDMSIEPIGSMGSVRHIMAKGAMVTQMRWRRDSHPPDLWRDLDPSTRRALLNLMGGRPPEAT